MFTFTAKDVTWLTTVGGGGAEVQNRPWVLGTSIYEEVKLERWGRFIRTSP